MKGTCGKGLDYICDVILLLEEAPATDINSAIGLIESVIEKNPIYKSKSCFYIRGCARRAREAQQNFLA